MYVNSLLLAQINNQKSGAKPKVFIDGGQHAREWISPAVVTHMIHQVTFSCGWEIDMTNRIKLVQVEHKWLFIFYFLNLKNIINAF